MTTSPTPDISDIDTAIDDLWADVYAAVADFRRVFWALGTPVPPHLTLAVRGLAAAVTAINSHDATTRRLNDLRAAFEAAVNDSCCLTDSVIPPAERTHL